MAPSSSAPPSRAASRSHPYSSPRSSSTNNPAAGPSSSPLPSRILQPLSTRSPLPGWTNTPVRTSSSSSGNGKRKADELEEEEEEEIDEIEEDDGEEMGGKAEEREGEVAREESSMGVREEEPQQEASGVDEDEEAVTVESMVGVVVAEEGKGEEVEEKEGGNVEVDLPLPPSPLVQYPPPPPIQALKEEPFVPQPQHQSVASSSTSTRSPAHSPAALLATSRSNLRAHPPSTAAGAAAIARSLGSPVPIPRPQPHSQFEPPVLPYPKPWQQQPQPPSNSPPPAYSNLPPNFPPQGLAGPSNYLLAPPPPAPVPKVEVEEVVVLSDEQQGVLDMVMSGQSLFFTGSAGTGKSFLLQQIIKRLKKTKKVIGVTASTGIAGLNIKGQTLHSWAGVGLALEDAETLAKKIIGIQDVTDPRRQIRTGHRPAMERWITTEVLIVDEISMIDGIFFDKLDHVGRRTRNSQLPFGGIQLVLVGDFFQLPPVPQKGKMSFAFEARSWKDCVPKMVHLSKVFRQKDDSFVRILNQMRLGCLDKTSNRILSGLKREIKYPDDIYSELYPVKAQVDSANFSRLKALEGQPYCYKAQDTSGYDEYDRPIPEERCKTLLNASRAPAEITLKVGAVVMLVVNLQNGSLCNGSLGKVVAFETRFEASRDSDIELAQVKTAADEDSDSDESDDEIIATDASGAPISGPTRIKTVKKAKARIPVPPPPVSHAQTFQSSMARSSPWDRAPPPPRDDGTPWPVVEFVTGGRLLMVPYGFEEQRFARGKIIVEATRQQVPLILAWALSVHKSQGQTLTRVKIDLQRTFEKGQAYVAVSRCTSLDTLQIINYVPSKVAAHPSVLAWARREGILQLDPDLVDASKWDNREVDLGGGMGMGQVIKIGRG